VRALSALQPVHNAAAAAKIKKYPKCMMRGLSWRESSNKPARSSSWHIIRGRKLPTHSRVFGINDDRDWAVVGEADDHLRTKFTGLDGLAKILRQSCKEMFVERHGDFGFGGADIRWRLPLRVLANRVN